MFQRFGWVFLGKFPIGALTGLLLAAGITHVLLRELNQAVREQEEKVAERRKVLETIVRTKGIIYQGKDSFAELPDEEAPGEAAPGSPEAPVFVDAKKDYEADQQLLQTMKLHQIKQEILLKIPKEGVLFHNEPVIADSPVSPNIPLYLTIGAVLGLLFAPLLPRPLMWVLHRLFPAKAPLTAAQP
jgi:hypothetical protein